MRASREKTDETLTILQTYPDQQKFHHSAFPQGHEIPVKEKTPGRIMKAPLLPDYR